MNKAHLHFPIKSVGGHGNWQKRSEKGVRKRGGDQGADANADADEKQADADADHSSCHRRRQQLALHSICPLLLAILVL